jgi:hypothetical protein
MQNIYVYWVKFCNNTFIVYYWNALYDQHTFQITAYICNSLQWICPLTMGKQDFGEGNNGTHDTVFQLAVHDSLTIYNFSYANLRILCYIIHFIRAGILTHLQMAVVSVFTSFHQLMVVCIEHYYFTTEITIMITLLSAICHFASVTYLTT